MSKYLPEGWTQDRIDDALESQRKSPNPTNPKQEEANMEKQAKDKAEKATARPWKVKEGSKIVAGKNQTVICDTYGYIDEYAFQPHRDANAALIVRCVNSHDALVEALENVLDLSYRSDNTEPFEVLIPSSALKKIESALKLAKGE